MKVLFVHQNFPGQFPRLSKAMKNRGHTVLALTDLGNKRASPVEIVRYKALDRSKLGEGMARHFAESAERGVRAALAARSLRDNHQFTPDVVLGHSGWGEMMFLKEVWPSTPMIVYSELMFRSRGMDVGFDPEFPQDPLTSGVRINARQAHLIETLVFADHGVTPTRFQRDSHPKLFHPKLTVLHDGIETARVVPDAQARLTLEDGASFSTGDEVLTYVSRGLEPYRGFHVFMRALPRILAARPNAHVIIVGDNSVSYGGKPEDAPNWREKMLAEVGGTLDLGRVHFTGRVPYNIFIRVLQVSRAHVYLTYPFVLSWSLLEAMSAGCQIIGSDTEPVREVITNGEQGLLVNFFDVDALAETSIEALANPAASAERRIAARQRVLERYELNDCLPRWIRLLESCGQITEDWPNL